MDELDVRIIRLEPMRVASFHAFGASPENDAAAKLVEWAKPKGYLDDPEKHRIFGFDNPIPSAGSPNYGYEYMIEIEDDAEPEDNVISKTFEGGLYAVTRCEVNENPYDIIPDKWMKLYEWVEDNSPYQIGPRQSHEEHVAPFPFKVTDNFTIDLYLSIEE
jgi:AraC family transcriptional regulator